MQCNQGEVAVETTDAKFTVVENYYFKVAYNGPRLISGLPLPDPAKGPYRFIGCDFHPALREVIAKDYADSRFENCDMP